MYVERGDIQVDYCLSEDMAVNILTKPLASVLFMKLIRLVGVENLEQFQLLLNKSH